MQDKALLTSSSLTPKNPGSSHVDDLDAVVIGAGFSGIYMIHKLVALGFKAIVLEEASGVGGTWFWNRYPGARCDVESAEYSYSFSEELLQEWTWTHRYSTQPEIMDYANFVVNKFDLRSFIKFQTKVTSAEYNSDSKRWQVKTDKGGLYSTRYCMMATGTLSSVNRPRFEGLDSYKGDWYLTGRWPSAGVDFTGLTVGIIGTGSTAVQAIPVIAQQAKHLTVFQRTANYSIPAENRPLAPEESTAIKANYPNIWAKAKKSRQGMGFIDVGTKKALQVSPEERESEFDLRWAKGGAGFGAAFTDLLVDESANSTAAEYVKSQIRNIVHDPVTAKLLSPKITLGCKRMCIDSGYYAAFNRENVTLIDVNETPIECIVADGVQTPNGVLRFDVLIFAMGFDALTGALLNIDIKGKAGQVLKEKWMNGPRSYLGLLSAGFPNMFTITGPGSPSVLSNMIRSIEQHVDWITECIKFLESSGKTEIEADLDAENEWMNHVEEIAQTTLRYGCNSWYLGSNVPGKKRIFMPYSGGLPRYAEKCREVVEQGYQGFAIN